MNIKNDYPVMVFKREHKGITFYSLGLSRKDRDGNYINGYMPCQFKMGVPLGDKTKIYIKSAWLTFYLKDKETKPYIFINEYETVEETIQQSKQEQPKVDPFEEMGMKVQIEDYEDASMELPF